MPFPYRAIASIQSLPSIFTTFPVNLDEAHSSNSSSANSGTCLISRIEDGIEMVPFEISPQPVAPMWDPFQAEKEVLVASWKDRKLPEKPLPKPPVGMWQRRLSLRRTLVALGLQFAMLLIVVIVLLASRRRLLKKSHSSQTAVEDLPHANLVDRVQPGSFSLPIHIPQQQSSACLAQMNESISWQCAYETNFQLNISTSAASEPNKTMISLGASVDNDKIHLGQQAPRLQSVELILINQAGSGEENAAYHFSTTYDQVVILREDDFAMSNEETKYQSPFNNTSVQPGDSLLRCIFNNTLIEGFIYIHQPSMNHSNSTSTNNTTPTANNQSSKLPYVFRLVEQRKAVGKAPYCEKVTVKQDGSLSSNGVSDIILKLSQASGQPVFARRGSESKLKSNEMARFQTRQISPTIDDCQCQWLIQ